MEWFDAYREDVAWVFSEAESRLSNFPASLQADAARQLQQYHPFQEKSHKNYICYLLPFWMGQPFSIENRILRQISLANVFLMMHLVTQDDVMDDSSVDRTRLLALSHLFATASVSEYQQLFDSNSLFWDMYAQYATQWADAVCMEQQASSFVQNPISIAAKAAPVKCASTAVLLVQQNESLLPLYSRAVDAVLAALQMADDWADWREDLQLQNANSLLALIRSEPAYSYSLPPSPEHIHRALCLSSISEHFVQIAEAFESDLQELERKPNHLIAFYHALVTDLRKGANTYTLQREKMKLGGFSYWLSKNIVNT
ncbi:hypothetical protein [Marinicrinis sediminis]|uniref:Terpene synthase n=1 Tax=Marinicrinis sediminis TaxID=1652465 RepID=A0ABW5RFA4_9BACL